LLEAGRLVAGDDLAVIDHERSEYADRGSAACDFLGFGSMDADDACTFSNKSIDGDLDVLEEALRFSKVSDESRRIRQ